MYYLLNLCLSTIAGLCVIYLENVKNSHNLAKRVDYKLEEKCFA